MPKVPSAKKQAEDAKRLAKLLQRIERTLKAREAMIGAQKPGLPAAAQWYPLTKHRA